MGEGIHWMKQFAICTLPGHIEAANAFQEIDAQEEHEKAEDNAIQLGTGHSAAKSSRVAAIG